MDIEKRDLKFGSPVLITLALLIIIPSSTGYIDCKISCRRCQKNTEHPAVLEVYCAMCKECKQRRRERILGRTTKVRKKISPLVRMRDGIEVSTDNEALMMRPQEALHLKDGEQDLQPQYLEQQEPPQQSEPELPPPEPVPPSDSLEPPEQFESPQEPQKPSEPQQLRLPNPTKKALRGVEYPYGCPTPPICSDSEADANSKEKLLHVVDKPALSAATTTTPTTCPPVPKCKQKHDTNPPCMNPCMVPPMCPCPYMYPMVPPGVHPTLPGMDPQTNYPILQLTQTVNPQVIQAINTPSTTIQEYHYVYIGIPKREIKELHVSQLY